MINHLQTHGSLSMRKNFAKWCITKVIIAYVILSLILGDLKVVGRILQQVHKPSTSIADPAHTSRRIPIPSNSNSTIVSDIKDIWHAPEKLAICVSIKSDARCPHPALLGRLSGPALALLEWTEEESENNGTFIHCGSYKEQWLEVGTYFLDIIVLFCNDFGIDALRREQNESAWLSYNFEKDCMEDPNFNRITGAKSYVMIEKNLTHQTPHLAQMGRWVSNTPSQSEPEPLHTRYQPEDCRINPQLERCEVPINE